MCISFKVFENIHDFENSNSTAYRSYIKYFEVKDKILFAASEYFYT